MKERLITSPSVFFETITGGVRVARPSKVKTDKAQKCYYCGQIIESLDDLVIKKFPMATKAGIRQYNRKLHTNCLLEYKERVKDDDLKKVENSEWDEVYKYFRKEILGLKETVPLQQHEIQRLLGLRLGQYYPSGNNTRILPRGYTFKEILFTLKVVKSKVRNYLNTGNFKNHKHRIDGIMRFVSGEINDVSKRLEAQKSSNKKLEQLSVSKEESFDYTSRLEAKTEKENGVNKNIQALFGDNL